jgi:hypothetical protein
VLEGFHINPCDSFVRTNIVVSKGNMLSKRNVRGLSSLFDFTYFNARLKNELVETVNPTKLILYQKTLAAKFILPLRMAYARVIKVQASNNTTSILQVDLRRRAMAT